MRRFLLCALFVTTPAMADLIEPEVASCAEASEGDGCDMDDGSMGTCQPGECCRLDYSTDASTPPSVCSDCLRCIAGAPPAGGQMANGGATPTGGASGGAMAAGGADGPAGGSDGGEDDDDSGCSAGLSSEGGLGVLALLFGGLLAVRLRRTR